MNESRNMALDATEQQVLAILEELAVANTSVEDLSNLTDGAVEAIYSFAYMYYEKGIYSEAEILFRLLTGLRIRSSKYWMGLGAAFEMQKKYAEAIEAYEWAAVNDKSLKDPYPHIQAAKCLYSLNEIKRALQALNSAKIIAKKEKTSISLVSQIDFLEKIWKTKVNHGRN